MIYPTDLTDSHRAAGAVASYQTFVAPKIWQRKRKQPIRAMINGILYVVKGGISWRMMSNDLPDWRLVYYYFR